MNKLYESIIDIVDGNNDEIKQENSNKDASIVSTQRDYMAGEVSKAISREVLIPEDIIRAHDKGVIHFHDMDFFALRMHNCELVNLEDMLQNGTVISGTYIDKPNSLRTAATLTTQIVSLVASSTYGGQTISLAHLAPFVDISRQKNIRELKKKFYDMRVDVNEEKIKELAELELLDEIKDAIQTIQYQLITLSTSNGQSPFVSIFICLEEAKNEQEKKDLALLANEMFKQRIKGVKNKAGQWIGPAFPKLIYVLDEENIEDDSEYYWLSLKAAECTSKRMTPDFISAKIMKELKEGDVYPVMGCRAALTPHDEHKYYGRFNQGVVTINLPYVALESGCDTDTFWEILDERLELCHRALQVRHNRLKGTKASNAPILWCHGALARLNEDDTIDKLLYNNYSTLSLGYAGLYETVRALTGKSHTEEEGKEFALKLMTYLKETCDKWREESGISYSLYGTPMESTTEKFAKSLKDFPEIKNVNDHNYITNSYHVNVREEIDAFSKITLESEFQELSPGGSITYVESPDMSGNIEAVMTLMKHIYNSIMYAEINSKFDACHICGFEGEIIGTIDKDENPVWECPNCGNHDQDKMTVTRRTCGYIGSNFWNKGRSNEIIDRVLHV